MYRDPEKISIKITTKFFYYEFFPIFDKNQNGKKRRQFRNIGETRRIF